MADSPVEPPEDADDEIEVITVEQIAEGFRGFTWRWTRWTPTPAILYEPEPASGWTTLYDPRMGRPDDAPSGGGRESPSFFDHDHCTFCADNRMSAKASEFDFPYGWTTPDPAGDTADYVWWACPTCFERLRERFEWKTEPPS